jgi:hypothetical protein
MALIVETGLLIANANSYVDLSTARSFALSRQREVPTSNTDLESHLIKAMDFIESHGSKFKGSKVDEDQSLQWPRQDVYIDGFLFDYQSIPQQLKNLQCQLVIEIEAGVDLFPTVTDPFVTEETVGPLRIKYSGQYGISNRLPYVDSFLKGLLKVGSGFLVLERF